MMPVCPKCGEAVIYITSANAHENGVFMVNAVEKQYITKTGRVSVGYQVHKCTQGIDKK